MTDRKLTATSIWLAALTVAFVAISTWLLFSIKPADIQRTIDDKLSIRPAEVLEQVNKLRADIAEIKAEQRRVREAVERALELEDDHGAAENTDSEM